MIRAEERLWNRPEGCTAVARTGRSPVFPRALAEYLNVDPTIIRVLFIVFAVMGGAGALIYLAMWLVVPEEP
jgi:hypothetical protein